MRCFFRLGAALVLTACSGGPPPGADTPSGGSPSANLGGIGPSAGGAATIGGVTGSSGGSGSGSGAAGGAAQGGGAGAGATQAGASSSGAAVSVGGAGSAGASGAGPAAGGRAGAGGSGGGGGRAAIPDAPWVTGKCSAASGMIQLETAEFCVSLSKTAQTISALAPKVAPGFDFTPADLVATRASAGYFHLGDLTLRVRPGSSGEWQNVTTSAVRAQVSAGTASGDVLATADLAAVLPANFPLKVTRSWSSEGGRLVLRFELTNKSSAPVQIGALGIPMVFNNVISNRSLSQAHATCSFADPYIGQDAGYVQVTRLSGQGPALLVLPDGKTPLEAYNPILNPRGNPKDPPAVFTDLTQRAQTFEGFYEWMVHTRAYADKEWVNAKPWNAPTSLTLAAGEGRTYGVRFALADRIRNIESVLVENQRPVAVGIPGYILPADVDGKLFLNYPAGIESISVEPPGALVTTPLAPNGAWKAYSVKGAAWGRSRLSVLYEDGTQQTIHYYVTKPASEAVADLGKFLTTKSWFVDAADPFGRSPSVMTYDRELGKIVTQSRQAWVCGLGDDGGATWLAGAMKSFGQPDPSEVAKYQQFIDGVVWGGLQYSSGALKYGVKRTLFYYEPEQMPAGTYQADVAWKDANGQVYWGAWNKAHTLETPRSYNYPHVAALYWAMYRLARNNVGLVTNHPWDWYLNQAYETAVAMTTIGNGYARYGLMDGTVFLEILRDLQREGLTASASELEGRMKTRANAWNAETYPFASEMAWDSTGQEEVYAWTRHFGFAAKAKVCVDAITGYMPTVPHWGYNGCARRYWDFLYGGSKTDRLERMIHHYGSSLNAIPILTEYRDHPDDLYLLRIGYAGTMGSLSNIGEDGFPSMAFHAFPDSLGWDPISGDYGLSFFGHAHSAATYLVSHSDFGWQAFGGNVRVQANTVSVTPLDAFRRRIYLAPVGLWLTLDAGRFQRVDFDSVTKAVVLTLDAADANTPAARLRVEQPAAVAGVKAYAVLGSFASERGASVVPLGSGATTLSLTPQ